MSPLIAATQPIPRHRTPVCWDGIRFEYYKVWADFPMITRPFGIRLEDEVHAALGHMLVSMDLIDSAIDRQRESNRRIQIGNAVCSWMSDPLQSNDPMMDQTFSRSQLARMRYLAEIIRTRQIVHPFIGAARRVLAASESKRNARSVTGLVRHLTAEGQAASEMTLLMMNGSTNPRLTTFLERIMRVGTVVDTMLDARQDFASGELRMRPNRWFYGRLLMTVLCRVPGLVAVFPDRRLLWRYCLSFTRRSVVPLAAAHSPTRPAPQCTTT